LFQQSASASEGFKATRPAVQQFMFKGGGCQSWCKSLIQWWFNLQTANVQVSSVYFKKDQYFLETAIGDPCLKNG
jgi:hypothetical protein